MNYKTKKLVLLAMLICIEFILMFTPLGYIPIGPIRATTLHIPVIMAGILMGAKEGAIVGFVFGVSSVIINTFAPTVTSFVFSPFYSLGEFQGGFPSLIIALVPRILLGVLSSYLYKFMKKLIQSEGISSFVSGVMVSILHTVMVLGLIYLFFAVPYAQVKGIAVNQLLMVLMMVIATNGIMEAILGGVVVSAASKALSKTGKRV